MENVHPTREDRLWGFLRAFIFCEFRRKEFFNSHSQLHSLTCEKANKRRKVVQSPISPTTFRLL
jgi:hypothetical protein